MASARRSPWRLVKRNTSVKLKNGYSGPGALPRGDMSWSALPWHISREAEAIFAVDFRDRIHFMACRQANDQYNVCCPKTVSEKKEKRHLEDLGSCCAGYLAVEHQSVRPVSGN